MMVVKLVFHDPQAPWYHGSPLALAELLADSTITRDHDLERVFSHKPTIVSQDVADDGRCTIPHTGVLCVGNDLRAIQCPTPAFVREELASSG